MSSNIFLVVISSRTNSIQYFACSFADKRKNIIIFGHCYSYSSRNLFSSQCKKFLSPCLTPITVERRGICIHYRLKLHTPYQLKEDQMLMSITSSIHRSSLHVLLPTMLWFYIQFLKSPGLSPLFRSHPPSATPL